MKFVQKRPEQWLEEVAPEKKQGIFKLFLGYAPGVGKTYSMLSEGIRRYSRGEDVVVGVVETHGRKGVAELVAKLDDSTAKADRLQGHGLYRNGCRRHPCAQTGGRAGR